MNKIVIINDVIDKSVLDEKIELEYTSKKELFAIPTINIMVKANTKLKIDYKSTIDTKMNINIEVLDDVKFTLEEFKKGVYYKTKYQYTLGNNSQAIINKFYYLNHCKELVEVDLACEKAIIEYNFKTIAMGEEKYEFIAHHNANQTNSLINSKGLAINDGKIMFSITGFVKKNANECILKQEGKIVNLATGDSEIKRNLYDENNTTKYSHDTLVDSFKEKAIKKLMVNGLNRQEALNYLIKEFILNDKSNKRIKKIIDNLKK